MYGKFPADPREPRAAEAAAAVTGRVGVGAWTRMVVVLSLCVITYIFCRSARTSIANIHCLELELHSLYVRVQFS